MINERIESTRTLVRRSLYESKAAAVVTVSETVDDALDYFELDGDHDAVRDKLKSRGAIGIKKTRDDEGYETYVKQQTAEMIDQGLYETVVSGVGRKIIESRMVTTNRMQSWEWLSDQNEKLDPAVASVLTAHRLAGGFSESLADADWISCAVESGPLFVDWRGGHLCYDPVSPACIYAKYHDQISDNGIDRGVNYKDIEDASAVVFQLSTVRGSGQTDTDKQQYLAIFGRSVDYPLGRYVIYLARNWQDFPEVGAKDSVDYRTKSGEIANPLSWAAEKTNNAFGVEYPVTILRGGISKTTADLIPIRTSLYESCLEIDVSLSRTLKDSLRNALGTIAVNNEFSGTPLPKTIEGAISLLKGQSITNVAYDGTNTQISMENIQLIARTIAEGYGVPGHVVFSHSSTVQESGVLLYMKMQPLVEHRDSRVALNRSAIDRLYRIERALHYAITETDPMVGVVQRWNPGRWILPEDPTAKQARLKSMLDSKGISYVRFVRDLNDLATDDDAKAYIETMREQESEYPAPGAAQRPNIGIVPRQPR